MLHSGRYKASTSITLMSTFQQTKFPDASSTAQFYSLKQHLSYVCILDADKAFHFQHQINEAAASRVIAYKSQRIVDVSSKLLVH